MCKEDIRIGRKTKTRYSTATVSGTNIVEVVRGDAGRVWVNLLIQNYQFTNNQHVIVGPLVSGVVQGLIAFTAQVPYARISVATHGVDALGPLYVTSGGVMDSGTVYVADTSLVEDLKDT